MRKAEAREFVVQKHAARRLHYDFRLELDGVLSSWAVPQGPSLVAGERRLAVRTEDHPREYASFEGVIPKGEYGGGSVVVWDRGYWHPIGDPRLGIQKGKLDFRLEGDKLRGRWHLIRTRTRGTGRSAKEQWLLIKGNDAEARSAAETPITEAEPRSVISGRSIEEVARDADRVWSSRTGEHDPPELGPPGAPSELPEAKRATLPERFLPELATRVASAPAGDEWLHEIKLDGYRLLCRLDRGKVHLFTRAGNDWTDQYPAVVKAARQLAAKTALLDGEVVILDKHGRSSFQALQRASELQGELVYFVFDLVHLDGYDLSNVPLSERKRALRQLLARSPESAPVVRYNDHVVGNGDAFFDAACRAGIEGVVSKRVNAPYRAGRSRSWLKVKCVQRQELVIVGYTDPAGARQALGALLLGVHDERGTLRYAGKVGTGMNDRTLRDLSRQLGPLARKDPPVTGAPRARGQHWVEPRLVAEVAFTEWTADGRVRHPSFLGLREDKPAHEVDVERPAPLAKAGTESPVVAGVRLSTPGRVYYPEIGLTKRELALYYETLAERVLPGLVERPLTLVRCPEGHTGKCFYQKRARDLVPESVPRVVVQDEREPYAMVTDLASLVSLVQISVLEFHVWGARADRLDRPDLLIFDLDPDEALPFERVVTTARVLQMFLRELGLVPFVRATGGKGLHVVVPIVRRSSWDELKTFSHDVALALVREAPDQLTAQMAKNRRHGRIFIDYLRNQPEATAIASYSTRRRPGAPVAVPLFWEELDGLDTALLIGVRDVPARLKLPDPWAAFEASRRPLGPAVKKLARLAPGI